MSISASNALFQPRVFSRTCIGTEALHCSAADFEGTTHCTSSVSVKLAKAITQDEFEPIVKAALIRLRHLVPAFALTVSKLPTFEYQQSYQVPGHLTDVEQWVSKILFFKTDNGSFVANHEKLARSRWWKARDGAYVQELHVTSSTGESSATNSWTLSLSSLHAGMDGRSIWMLFDKLLAFISDEINGHAPPLESLEWGKEVVRLTMAPQVICDVHEKGAPQPFPDVEAPPAPPEGFLPFLYTPRTNEVHDEDDYIEDRIDFDPDETKRLHAACKAHGRTVTQVMTALISLADVEMAFRLAERAGAEQFQHVASAFANASHFLSCMNFINYRHYLPAEYQTLDSKHGTPMETNDAVPLSFDIGPYQRMFNVQLENLSVKRQLDEGIFWNELVNSVAEAWKAVDKSFEAYRRRAAALTATFRVEEFDVTPLMVTAPLFSSFGDLSRLGYLEDFRPSTCNNTLTVDDLDFSLRSTIPASCFSFYEYDGRFTIKTCNGRKFRSNKEMKLQSLIVKELFEALVQN